MTRTRDVNWESAVKGLAVPRILLVEDDPNDAMSLYRALQGLQDPITKRNYELCVAPDISSARVHLKNDEIDIYIIDLEMPETKGSCMSQQIGKNFFYEVVSRTNAGVIICSTHAFDDVTEELLDAGADDSIWKCSRTVEERIPTLIKSRVRALWRRIQLTRPINSGVFAHTGRNFLVGDWRYVVGDRIVVRLNKETLRLTPTEHAFLRHICTIKDHRVDTDTFNQEILGRASNDPGARLDNFVYRLRVKLRNSIELRSEGHGTYKLFNVRELKPIIDVSS
jgi:DNA-binding response OmpR family regulator